MLSFIYFSRCDTDILSCFFSFPARIITLAKYLFTYWPDTWPRPAGYMFYGQYSRLCAHTFLAPDRATKETVTRFAFENSDHTRFVPLQEFL